MFQQKEPLFQHCQRLLHSTVLQVQLRFCTFLKAFVGKHDLAVTSKKLPLFILECAGPKAPWNICTKCQSHGSNLLKCKMSIKVWENKWLWTWWTRLLVPERLQVRNWEWTGIFFISWVYIERSKKKTITTEQQLWRKKQYAEQQL